MAYTEPTWLVTKTLKAAVKMRYPHRTFLLDDGRRNELASAAKKIGAAYIRRSNNKHAKAGNINHALEKTDGEIIVIFDTDHTPKPEFLERSLGHFRDPRVGFVQVMRPSPMDRRISSAGQLPKPQMSFSAQSALEWIRGIHAPCLALMHSSGEVH